ADAGESGAEGSEAAGAAGTAAAAAPDAAQAGAGDARDAEPAGRAGAGGKGRLLRPVRRRAGAAAWRLTAKSRRGRCGPGKAKKNTRTIFGGTRTMPGVAQPGITGTRED